MANLALLAQVLALAALVTAFIRQQGALAAFRAPPEIRQVHPEWLGTTAVVLILRDDPLLAADCVDSLLRQDLPGLSVIVVDERSGGKGAGLGEIVEDPRVQLVDPGPTRPGWTRPAHLRDVGVSESSSRWLLFVDEDVFFKRDAVRRLLGAAGRHAADIVAPWPQETAATPWQRIVGPFLAQLQLLSASVRAVVDPESPAVPEELPVVLVDRERYDIAGALTSVRARRDADVAIVQRIKQSGGRVLPVQGADLVIHETDENLSRTWKRWAPRFNALAENNPWRAWAIAVAILGAFVMPWILLLAGVVGVVGGGPGSPWVGVLLVGAADVLLAVALRKVLADFLAIDDSLVWSQPLAATLAAVMVVASTVHLEGGRLLYWSERLARLFPGSATSA